MGIQYIPAKEAFLTQLCELWNRVWGTEFPMRSELMRHNSFAGTAPALPAASWIAIQDNRTIGVVLAKSNHVGTGFISSLLVDPYERNQGIGSKLLTLAERALQTNGASIIKTGQDQNHYFPGVPSSNPDPVAWLTKRGYVYQQTVHDMLNSHREPEPPDGRSPLADAKHSSSSNHLPKTKPVTLVQELRLLRQDDVEDREALLRFLGAEFPGRWEQSTYSYFECGGTGREYAAAWVEGEMVGFCRLTDLQSPVKAASLHWSTLFQKPCGGIGPIGIAATYRGKGLGSAMLQMAIRILRERGCEPLIIDWTNHLEYYARFGFVPWRSYHLFEKKLIYENA